jgi:hypothetical protein
MSIHHGCNKAHHCPPRHCTSPKTLTSSVNAETELTGQRPDTRPRRRQVTKRSPHPLCISVAYGSVFERSPSGSSRGCRVRRAGAPPTIVRPEGLGLGEFGPSCQPSRVLRSFTGPQKAVTSSQWRIHASCSQHVAVLRSWRRSRWGRCLPRHRPTRRPAKRGPSRPLSAGRRRRVMPR